MNFITHKHLSRRTVLRGAGVALALPLLDAMIPAATALAQTAAAPKPRLGFIYFPHGAVMERWTPTTTDRDFTALHPRSAHAFTRPADGRQQYRQQARREPRGACAGAGHLAVLRASAGDPGARTWRPRPTRSRPSTSGRKRLIPRWKSRPPRDMAWAAPASAALAALIPARCPFRRPRRRCPSKAIRGSCFCACSVRATQPDERRFLNQQTTSILDMIAAETNSLSRTLGSADRAALSDYLESVHEIERRTRNADAGRYRQSCICRKCRARRRRTSMNI